MIFATMESPANIGRVFFGISIAVLGFQTIYGRDFPYMLIPPNHSSIPALGVIALVCGCGLLLAGACIVFRRQTRPASLLLGLFLLLIFLFYYVPYQLLSDHYGQLVQWESAEKELALSCGAFVIPGSLPAHNDPASSRLLRRSMSMGTIAFCITMISFGIIHFQFANDVAGYVPAWVPARLFWAYFAGAALIASGLAIIFKIRPAMAGLLLGIMIFSWFAILHVPRIFAAPPAYLRSEITSAFLALAYSGIALVIAGRNSSAQ